MIKFNRCFMLIVMCLLIIGFKGKILFTFLMVFLHELVHYITARFLGFSGFDIEILPIGAVLKLKDLDEATPLEDIIISLSGPLFNILLGVIFYICYIKWNIDYLRFLTLTNFALGFFNLIPALPLDGGRVLRDILNIKSYYKKANSIAVNISFIIGSALIICYFFLFYNKNQDIYNISIGLIGLFIIMYSLREKERIAYFIMGDIIKKKFKFMKRKYVENRTVSVYSKENLLFLMNLIDTNRYNIFYVLDKDMHIIDIIYEMQVIEGLKEYGNITIEEYINLR